MQKLLIKLTALSPITHMMGSVGNKTVVRTQDIRTEYGVAKVPVISGNAIRHMIREQWADSLNITDQNKREACILYSGGAERSSGGKPSLHQRQQILDYLPGLALLGTSTKDDILSGVAEVDYGTLVCRETAGMLQAMYPDLVGSPDWSRLSPASHFVSDWQYYRHDPVFAQGRSVSDEEGRNTSMPFGGNCVIPGSVFLTEIRIGSDSSLLMGCLLNSLSQWIESGCVIGGMGSRGHGRFDCEVYDSGVHQQELIDEFRSHQSKNIDIIRGLIGELAA